MISEMTLQAEVSKRNALRREAKLPLLDVAAEIERGHAEERRRSYGDFLNQHASILAECQLQVVAEFEERRGCRPATAMGWWGVYHQAQSRFEAEVERRFGVARPRS